MDWNGSHRKLSLPENDTITLEEYRRWHAEGQHQCVTCGLPVDRAGDDCPRCREAWGEDW